MLFKYILSIWNCNDNKYKNAAYITKNVETEIMGIKSMAEIT